MNSFQRFGIDHLSASSLNLWTTAPGLFALRYIAGVKDQANAAMSRGTATERGIELLLRGKTVAEAQQFALAEYQKLVTGEITDEIAAENALIAPMVKQAHDWKTKTVLEPLAATQFRVETWLESISIPIVGYVDFSFMEGADIDTKTTKRCPSSPSLPHLRQIAVYNKARNRPQALLYITDKKYAYYQPTQAELDDALDDLRSSALALNNFLARMDNKEDVLRSLPVDYEHYAAPKIKVPLANILLGG